MPPGGAAAGDNHEESDDHDDQDDEKEERLEARRRGESPSRLIDARIKEVGDWRGEMLARVRMLIKQVDPERRSDGVEAARGVPDVDSPPIAPHTGVVTERRQITIAKGASSASCIFTLRTRRFDIGPTIDPHGDDIDARLRGAIRASWPCTRRVEAGRAEPDRKVER